MKTRKANPEARGAGVEKVLLQMARQGDDWAGKATSFTGPSEFYFESLDDLVSWLRKRAERP